MKRFLALAFLITAISGNLQAQVPGKIPDKFGKTYADNAYLRFGNAEDAICGYNTLQTNDALVCGLSTDSETFILMQKADIATDMGLSDLNTPNLTIANADPTKWLRIYHDGTNPVISTNTGVLSVSGNVGVTSSLVFEGATADAFETTLSVTDPTADRTVTVPDASGTVLLGGNTTILSGANTACDTTCGGATKCVAGQDAGASNVLVACNSASADVCICSSN